MWRPVTPWPSSGTFLFFFGVELSDARVPDLRVSIPYRRVAGLREAVANSARPLSRAQWLD